MVDRPDARLLAVDEHEVDVVDVVLAIFEACGTQIVDVPDVVVVVVVGSVVTSEPEVLVVLVGVSVVVWVVDVVLLEGAVDGEGLALVVSPALPPDNGGITVEPASSETYSTETKRPAGRASDRGIVMLIGARCVRSSNCARVTVGDTVREEKVASISAGTR